MNLVTAIGSLLFLLTKGLSAQEPESQPFKVTPDNESQGQGQGSDRQTYIVTFKAGQDPSENAQGLANQHGGSVKSVWETVLNGAAVELPPGLAKVLAQDDAVEAVEEDQIATAFATVNSWGQDRVDQCDLSLDGQFNKMDASSVRMYVVDTGIYQQNSDFNGKIGTDCHRSFIDEEDELNDGNGHGTHVGSTMCGVQYGIVTCKELCAVKVLSNAGSGTYSGVINGINFVANNCPAGTKCVANMSLGGGVSSALNDAVNNAVAAGITFVVAAGNDNADACTISPASAASAITVGATASNDVPPSWTNFGSCVDIYGQGVFITAAWTGSASATNTISGTSMASPHVAALAAAALESNQALTSATVGSFLDSTATKRNLHCKSPGKALAVNPNIDCSGSALAECPPPSTCRASAEQCVRRNCSRWINCDGNNGSCCCCSGLSCNRDSRCQ